MIGKLAEILTGDKIKEAQQNTKILAEKTNELIEELKSQRRTNQELIRVLREHGRLLKDLSDALSQSG